MQPDIRLQGCEKVGHVHDDGSKTYSKAAFPAFDAAAKEWLSENFTLPETA